MSLISGERGNGVITHFFRTAAPHRDPITSFFLGIIAFLVGGGMIALGGFIIQGSVEVDPPLRLVLTTTIIGSGAIIAFTGILFTIGSVVEYIICPRENDQTTPLL